MLCVCVVPVGPPVAQREWGKVQLRLMRISVKEVPKMPRAYWRQPAFHLVQDPRFEWAIMGCIGLNTVSERECGSWFR